MRLFLALLITLGLSAVSLAEEAQQKKDLQVTATVCPDNNGGEVKLFEAEAGFIFAGRGCMAEGAMEG